MSAARGALRGLATAALAALLAAGAASAQGAADSAMRAVHDAVFDAWLPLDDVALAGSERAAGRALRDAVWERFSRSGDMRRLLSVVRATRVVGPPGSAPVPFVRATLREREDLLVGMLKSPTPEQRRAGMSVRLAYLSAIYGSEFGRRVAGIDGLDTPPAGAARPARPTFPRGWVAYDSTKQRLFAREGRIDDVIVGSGPAGCVLAHELRKAGRHVLVLEQGSFVVPGAMNTRAFAPLLESAGRRASTSGSVLFNNAETVGGGSTVNIDLVFPPDHSSIQRRIAQWRKSGAIPPGMYDLASLRAADAWVQARLKTRTPDASEINRNNRVLWDGATRAGLHPKLYQLDTDPPGAWASPATDKRSAVTGLLLEAMQAERDPVALVPDARVMRVLTEEGPTGKVAIGVEFVARAPWANDAVIADPMRLGIRPGATVTVRASRVILCAGALGSAAILLRSEIDDPDVGRGVVAHPAVPVIGRFDETIDAFRGTPATVYVDDYATTKGWMLEAMSAPPEYAALMTPGTGREILETVKRYRNLAGFGVMLIDESARDNCIFPGPGGDPQIRYELTTADRVRLGEAVETAARLMFAAGAREVMIPSYESAIAPPSAPRAGLIFTDSAQVVGLRRRLQFLPNATLITSAHLQATNKMGGDPEGSVVSPRHEAWNVRRLYVCDASVFPTSVGANPMESVYVFAKLFADELLRGAAPAPPARPGAR